MATLESLKQRLAELASSYKTIKAAPLAAPIAKTTTPVEGPIAMDVEKKKKAEGLIAAFEKEAKASPIFKHITYAEILLAIKVRLNNPDGVDQANLNVCGAATFSRFWLIQDPEGYTKAVIELYMKGKTTYNGIKIEANSKMKDQNTALNEVDWLLMASLQNSGGLLGYNPEKEMGGIRGIALPSKVLEWFEKLPNTETEKYSKDLDPAVINATYKGGGAVVFLINANVFDNYFTDQRYNSPDDTFMKKVATAFNGITGNHYVALNSPITKKGDLLRLEIWTWGTSLEVVMSPKAFKSGVVKTYLVKPKA
jgi:hypothetical protein